MLAPGTLPYFLSETLPSSLRIGNENGSFVLIAFLVTEWTETPELKTSLAVSVLDFVVAYTGHYEKTMLFSTHLPSLFRSLDDNELLTSNF
jgi:hypothetical protein